MKKTLVFRRSRGFTLVELAIVLAIVIVVTAIVVPMYNRNVAKNNAKNEITELQQIVAETKAKYQSAPTFTGATLAALINLQVFPDYRVTGAAAAVNAFGGAWALALNPPTNDQITLTSASYPRSACADIVTSAQTAFFAISINGTAVKTAGGALDIAGVGTNCNLDSNAIAFTFTKT